MTHLLTPSASFTPALRAQPAPAASAATDAPRRFDLPAGPAAETLRRFADESGLQVAFLADAVRDIATAALRGELAPRAALDRLLDGTGLVVIEDARTGALLVARAMSAATRAKNPGLAARVAAGLAALAGSVATAQTPPGAEEKVQLAAFTVTGSNIPTAADAVAVPVTIIAAADIQRSGVDTNLLEVLQKTMPAFSGAGNLGVTNGNTAANNTYGGSQISLRSLATLVLLDGRRVPDNGANARGSRAFVDVNQFPLAAVQSVEVLTDGASAIYGSDAVGGVVNVKLKHDFQGLEFGGRYGFSNRTGDYHERSAYVVAGVKKGPVSLTVSFTDSRVTPLLQSERPFSNPQVGKSATISGAISQTSTTFPTAFLRTDLLAPSRAVPTGAAAMAADLAALVAAGVYQASNTQAIANNYDLAPTVTLTIESRKRAYTLAGTIKLIPDRLELFVEAVDSISDSMSQLAAVGITQNVPVNAAYNPTRSAIWTAFRYGTAPRQYQNSGELHRLVGGLRGKLGERFRWEAATNYNVNRLKTAQTGLYYNPNLQLAIFGGYDAAGNAVAGGRYARVFRDYAAPAGATTLAQLQAAITPANSVVQPALDFFARPGGVDPASLANILGSSALRFKAPLTQFDARVSGTALDLPAGPLGIAAGLDHRIEKIIGSPDQNSYSTGPTSQRWTGGTFFDPVSRRRTIDAAFAEVRVPLASERMNLPALRLLELSAAYRHEKYSDAGASRVPKYGLRWRPAGDELTLRGTYSEAFAAPSLFALFGPVTQGSTAAAVIPSIFGVPGTSNVRQGSNADLKPSTARTHSLGAVYSPRALKGLTVGLDYVRVTQASLVGTAGSAEILRSVNELGAASPYAAQVAIGNWPSNPDPSRPAAVAITSPGQLAAQLRSGASPQTFFVTDSRINISGQRVEALDVNATYAFPNGSFGRFKVASTGTFFLSYRFQALPSQPFYQYAGHVTNGGTGSQGTLPGMKWFNSLQWSHGNWSAALNNTYIDRVVDLGPGGVTFATSTTLARVPIPSYAAWDASVSRTFRGFGNSSRARTLSALRVSLGVNNLSNRMPPLATQSFGSDAGVDLTTYSPIGRLWYLSAGVKF
ncbi:MAG: TonB-dependent receptor [Opitutaceae bacterium]|nr:TonB-dependent receptor [Opitutaceae bacterium]